MRLCSGSPALNLSFVIFEVVMSQLSSQTMPTDKFMLIAVNLLHRKFIDAARTDAKNLYKQIHAGQTTHITTVQMEDNSTVKFGLAMDHSEYQGKLNYGAFRAGLGTLLANISKVLQEGTEVQVFNPEQRPESMLFGVTGVTVEDNKPNVMVLGADVGGRSPAVILKLVYLDHSQFIQTDTAAVGSPVKNAG